MSINHTNIINALNNLESNTDIQKELFQLFPEETPFDCPQFSVSDYINQHFPDEQSLSSVQTVLSNLNLTIQELDDKIEQAVVSQTTAIQTFRQQLESLKIIEKDLISNLTTVHTNAKYAESQVDDVCRDIRLLDKGKTNLTTTIASFKRLSMLVTALEQLRRISAERNYMEVANLVLAADQLASHFQDLRSVSRIQKLLTEHASIIKELKAQITEDFDSIFDPDTEAPRNLIDACRAADAISIDFRVEILEKFTIQFLEPYRRAFSVAHNLTLQQPPGPFDNLERRFVWLKRNLREFPNRYGFYFLTSWNTMCNIGLRFCRITREQFVDILGSNRIDPPVLVRVLHKTKEFEEYLDQTFTDMTPGTGAHVTQLLTDLEERNVTSDYLSSPIITDLQYPSLFKKDAEHYIAKKEPHPISTSPIHFTGYISGCFEAYMMPWVRLEEQRLQQLLMKSENSEEVTRNSTDDTTTTETGLIYSSAIDILAGIKSSFQRCVTISSGHTLLDMFIVFKKILRQYLDCIGLRIPKLLSLDHSSHSSKRTLCIILGTLDYLHLTMPHILDAILDVIHISYRDQIEFRFEEDHLLNLKSLAMKRLMEGLQIEITSQLKKMSAKDWVNVNDVGDESDWVKHLTQTLMTFLISIYKDLSVSLFRLFCDVFSQWFLQIYHESIYDCQQISELGAQQLLLDTSSLKSSILELPVLASHGMKVSTVYSKTILREFGRCELILKILTSSNSSPDTLLSLLSEDVDQSSTNDLQRVLQLRVT